MELVDCRVNLNGDQLNQVMIKDVTPAEMLVLRHIHGPEDPGVVTPVGAIREDQRPSSEERERLDIKYSRKIFSDDELGPVARVLGPEHMEVPLKFDRKLLDATGYKPVFANPRASKSKAPEKTENAKNDKTLEAMIA